MKYPIFQVDAFADRVFAGNPAAVVPLPAWLPDAVLLAIARENNLSETAFLVEAGAGFALRWFTPAVEVDLCGHATLASAHVAFEHLGVRGEEVRFSSKAGELRVAKDGERLALDFPARPPEPRELDPMLAAALGSDPLELHVARDWMAVFSREEDILALAPDFSALARLDAFAVIATAPGKTCDFVSRFFAPRAGVAEDPVTGSAHCTLVPFWSRRLGKKRLHARQVSARGGELHCEDRGARIRIAGRAVGYLRGEIDV
ncbi:MAG: PhzF family phenazine biosynthesis protein [Myxococcales bacterium]|nr:PhzF family phenazine biosynthesis protein [Myxococcales bacterium]